MKKLSQVIIFTTIFVFILFSSSAWSQSLPDNRIQEVSEPEKVPPYEANCSQNQINNTMKFASYKSQADYCFVCEYENKSSFEALSKIKEVSTALIPKECFLTIAVVGNHSFGERYSYCSEETNRHAVTSNGQRFCINEDYITTIHESFNKMSRCFNFNQAQQNQLFMLINRESRGILNARSETKARCLGQMTEEYVEHINDIIESVGWKNPYPDVGIWKDVLERCPDLESSRIQLSSITCESTQNPDKCLLYTFFGNKMSIKNIRSRLDSDPDYMGRREFPNTEEQTFISATDSLSKQKYQNMLDLLPMKRKEMMVMKGTFKEEFGSKEFHYVMWDDSEIYNNDIHKKIDWTKKVEIRKQNIFQKENDIVDMFMFWAHNGGGSVAQDGFTVRLERLKQQIARGGCEPNNQELRCQMRRQIERGEKIPSHLALDYFQRDLRRTYSAGVSRKIEVSEFIKNIIEARDDAFNTSVDKNKNKLIKHYNRNAIEDEKEILDFLKDSDQICPKLEYKKEEISF